MYSPEAVRNANIDSSLDIVFIHESLHLIAVDISRVPTIRCRPIFLILESIYGDDSGSCFLIEFFVLSTWNISVQAMNEI